MSLQPRAVLITRKTPFEMLLRRHATREQARFFLESRGRSMDEAEARDRAFDEALHSVTSAVPRAWRAARVDRDDLDRFMFEPEDVVVVVGQDGLVANVAKYLTGQIVVGINPDREANEGALVHFDPADAPDLFAAAVSPNRTIEERALVEASLDDGQTVLALNELFIGHHSHQTARYRISVAGVEERQLSSGVIVATGTGSTGWARSIRNERDPSFALPGPTDRNLVYFVREAFPAPGTGTTHTAGTLREGRRIEVVSEMDEGGVLFGDGIEVDRVEFDYGMQASIRTSSRRLNLLAR